MVWSVFNYLLTQKLPRKAKVALGCTQYKKLLKTIKVAQKLPSTIYLRLFGDVSERKTRSDHVTRNALAARNNEAYGQANGRQSFCPVLPYHLKHWTREFFHWPFSNCSYKWIIRLRLACVLSLPPPQAPLLRFFLRGGGVCT